MVQRIEAIVQARFLVASLGESASPAWWRTEATSTVGRRMLERLFPRTYLTASLETAGRAARIEHDARIGRIGVFHLFRFPVAEEAAVHDLLREQRSNGVLRELAVLGVVEDQLSALSQLAGGASSANTAGPFHCGDLNDLRHGRALRRICASYLRGFRTSTQTYPYLQGETR